MRQWLIQKRKKLNLTQEQVAEMAGISRVHYTKIETGQRRPSPEVAKAIAKALAFDWNLFFPDEEEIA